MDDATRIKYLLTLAAIGQYTAIAAGGFLASDYLFEGVSTDDELITALQNSQLGLSNLITHLLFKIERLGGGSSEVTLRDLALKLTDLVEGHE